MKRHTVKILDVRIDAEPLNRIQERLSYFMTLKNPTLITTPNTEFVMRAANDSEFKKILNVSSSLNMADSAGILWAARFLNMKQPKTKYLATPIIIIEWFFSLLLYPFYPRFFRREIPEKISGSDFIWTLAQFAADNKLRIFLLGGAPTVAERTALKLQTDIYGLRIAGVHSGSPKDTDEIVEAINRSHADIVAVAFGAPKQEIWLNENLKRTHAKIGIGLGGTFDFLAGERRRAPRFMQLIGLEWLFRLITEPRRAKRQASLPLFIWRVLLDRLSRI